MLKKIMKINAKKIKTEMKRLGWNYERLAKEMGVVRTYIYAYLDNKHSNPTLKTIQKFADALDLDGKDLLK